MDVESLEILSEVARRGSFAAAARARGLDPSKVSRVVSALEVKLGARLFHRTTRALSLTDAGESYLRLVAPALDRIQEAEQMVRDSTGKVTGILRVTSSVAYGTEVLAPLLSSWRRIYPQTSLDLILTDHKLDLEENNLDLALRLGPSSEYEGIHEMLSATQYRVCVGSGYAIDRFRAPKDLEKQDCLLFPYDGFSTEWLFRSFDGLEERIKVHGSLTISNPLALRSAATQSLGPALLADWMTATQRRSGELIDLFPEYQVTATDFATGVWVVLPRQWKQQSRYRPKRIDAFLEFLRSQVLTV